MRTRYSRGSILAALLASLSVPSCDDTTSPGGPPEVSTVGRIAFTSTRDGAEYVYVMNPDGSGLTRLVRGQDPAWSPDGESIAFGAYDGTSWEIRVIGVDGSGERRVIGDGAFAPTWSPDGRIAFWREGAIRSVNVDGTDETVIIDTEALRTVTGFGATGAALSIGSPTWSPDGERLAFVGSVDLDWEVVLVVDRDGSNLRRVPAITEGTSPAWSPDGSWLTYAYGDVIRSVSHDGSTGLRTHRLSGRDPDWSADGTNIVYAALRDSCRPLPETPCVTRIWVGEPDRGRFARLVPEAENPARPIYHDYQAVWSRVRG
ncbi:MAG: hypothetical protein R3195_11030 [Gemmatimonadota bacterium]|nr:hypothetical protein [Gemmatimonadota bacterium]